MARPPDATTVLAMLTDGRFPSGAHAYSAGMEQAVAWGDVDDLATAESFARGRAATSATPAAQCTAAAGAIATRAGPGRLTGMLDALDVEIDARTASRAAREVSRQQGRRWLRAVQGVWPEESAVRAPRRPDGRAVLDGRHGWVVVGVVGGRLGLGPTGTATVALYELVGTPLWAAARLLGLDPVATTATVARVLADVGPGAARAATTAARRTGDRLDDGGPVDWSWISWATAPLADLAAEGHLHREERLFAS
jgi:urease accessory protein